MSGSRSTNRRYIADQIIASAVAELRAQSAPAPPAPRGAPCRKSPSPADRLLDLVAEITLDLKLQRDGTVSAEQTRGSPPGHGVQRFHDGLDVTEVVAEACC